MATIESCGAWELGVDCGFDTWRFHFTWMIAWAITSAALVGMMFFLRLVGCPQRAAALMALASLIQSANSAFILINGKPQFASKLGLAGAFMAGMAIINVVHHWCDTAIDLLDFSTDTSALGTVKAITGLRYAFRVVELTLMPLVALRVKETVEVSVYSLEFTDMVQVALMVATAIAIALGAMMMFVSWRDFKGVLNGAYLRKTSFLIFWLHVVILTFSAYSSLAYYYYIGRNKFALHDEPSDPLEQHAWVCHFAIWSVWTFFLYVVAGLKKEEVDLGDKMEQIEAAKKRAQSGGINVN